MASYRLIHKQASTGHRTSDLDDLEFRVWVQYLLSADDFGVCPAIAHKFQGDNTRLAKLSHRKVQLVITRLVDVMLVFIFRDRDASYLYQPDWQDWQRIKHTSATTFPIIPAELLEKCSPKTIELFRENHHKFGETFPLHARACDATANATATAIAHAPANAPVIVAPEPQVMRSGHRGSLIISPLQYERLHGQHLGGFCDWVCLPISLVESFAKRIPGDENVDKIAQITAWAKDVRAKWTDQIIPDGSEFDFWRNRWTETHGGSKPASATLKAAQAARSIDEAFR